MSAPRNGHTPPAREMPPAMYKGHKWDTDEGGSSIDWGDKPNSNKWKQAEAPETPEAQLTRAKLKRTRA